MKFLYKKQGWETKYECLCQSLLGWHRQACKGTEYVPVSGGFQMLWVVFIDSLKIKDGKWIVE